MFKPLPMYKLLEKIIILCHVYYLFSPSFHHIWHLLFINIKHLGHTINNSSTTTLDGLLENPLFLPAHCQMWRGHYVLNMCCSTIAITYQKNKFLLCMYDELGSDFSSDSCYYSVLSTMYITTYLSSSIGLR